MFVQSITCVQINPTSRIAKNTQSTRRVFTVLYQAQSSHLDPGAASRLRRVAYEILEEWLDGVDDGVGKVLHRVENFIEDAFDLIDNWEGSSE